MNSVIKEEKYLIATVVGVFTLCTAVLFFSSVQVHHEAIKHTASALKTIH